MKSIKDCRFFFNSYRGEYIIAFPWITNPQAGSIVAITTITGLKVEKDKWAMIDGNDYFKEKEIRFVDVPDLVAVETGLALLKYNGQKIIKIN